METVTTNKPVIEIFWTGGWDSTFRVVMLSELDITIQPYYLADNRESENHELNAIAEIKEGILKREATKCTFRPLQVLETSKVRKDAQITASYEKFRHRLGSQYDWLARFALDHKGIEVCILDGGKPLNIISEFGADKKVSDPVIGDFYVIDKENSSREVIDLFGNLRFPLLKMTKLDLKTIAEEKGFMHLMDKTWFCYLPVNNEPCGRCVPCTYAINNGMEFLIPESGMRRHRWQHSNTRKFLSKLKWMILKPSWRNFKAVFVWNS